MKLLEVKHLDIRFPSGSAGGEVHAVNDVSFSLEKGEFLGLAGESGCGKSTAARLVAGLQKPDRGEIFLEGEPIRYPFPKERYRNIQMVFQLPAQSFDPRWTIGKSITNVQRNFGTDKTAAKAGTIRCLKQVGLQESDGRKYPHQLSGGECQRAAIARALAAGPQILICDEITSALDVSVQAQIVELLLKLKEQTQIAALFISHDLALIQEICDRILVMQAGRIVEEGVTDRLMRDPREDYTKKLLQSVLEPEL